MSIFYLRSNSVSPDPRVEKEVNCLLGEGYNVNIFAWDREGDHNKFDSIKLSNGSARIHRFKHKAEYGGGVRTLLKLIFFQFFLLYNLFKRRGDITVIHAADFDTVLPAVLMRLLFNKKVIYDIYDFYVDAFSVPRLLKGLIRNIDLWVIGYVDAVIITNESRIKQIKGSQPRELIVIHNTPSEDVEKINFNKYRDNSYDITLSYVGILQNGRLLEEILNVVSCNPKIRLLIAGFGQLEAVVKDFSSKFNNIIFFGKVDYNESLNISGNSDYLFATYDPKVPNHRYSSPNKLYEAMLLTKPIIVCRCTGIDILVEELDLGFVIDYSQSSFSDVISNLINCTDNEYSAIQRNLKKAYRESYSWTIMEERLKNLYKNYI